MQILTRNLSGLLDDVQQLILAGNLSEAFHDLFSGLREFKHSLQAESWRHFATVTAREHPLRALIHQDALTERAYLRPRGYPGDAPLLDLIYGIPHIENKTDLTPLGKQIYANFTYAAPACAAVRTRRQLVADRVTEISRKQKGARILSIAAGHLREAQLVSANDLRNLAEWCAVDQDTASLATITAFGNSSGFGVLRPVAGSVKDIFTHKLPLAKFDFVYSAGLYDYLNEPVAQQLTACMFSMLNPGGKLLIANFLPNIPDVGYMEAYMDWWLLYRTPEEMDRLAATLPQQSIARKRVYSEENNNIVFLEIDKETNR